MDLLGVLRERIETLAEGTHTLGLRAVLQHAEAAVAHLERGRKTGDEGAFTDTIYRCNQVFEGSLKEAYRVLAEKEPGRIAPDGIEKYIEQHKVLRPRVAAQFTVYRQNWRNPSTHEHCLDFDADEALLAVATVVVFATVLTEQIRGKLAFDQSKAEAKPVSQSVHGNQSLANRIEAALRDFSPPLPQGVAMPVWRRAELEGAVAGFLTRALPDAVTVSEPHSSEGRGGADILVEQGESKVLIEVKSASPSAIHSAVEQLARYMAVDGIREGLVVFVPRPGSGHPAKEPSVSFPAGRVDVVIIRSEKGLSSDH